jgi:hypothetical protein
LISNDYAFCNDLGREAHDNGMGGFFAPSARNHWGTTVPAFIVGTLYSPVIEAAATLMFDVGQTSVEIRELP